MTIDYTAIKIEYACRPPDNPEHMDAANESSELEALLQLYTPATSALEDDFLARCVIVQLRKILYNGFFTGDELLRSLEHVYRLDEEHPTHSIVQSIFLTAIIKHSVSLVVSEDAEKFSALLGKFDNLCFEWIRAMVWYSEV